MVLVHCTACGAVYNYNKEGCCPKCGAYNRPPKRERVMADGTVQHMTDAAYAKKKAYSDKVCFEAKECHEEKVCYEQQAQRLYRTPSDGRSGSAPSFAVPSLRRPKSKRSGGTPLVAILVAAGVLFGALMSMLDKDESEPGWGNGSAVSLFSVGRDDWEKDNYWREAEMDEPFVLPDGTVMAVTGVAWSGEDRCYRIYMAVENGDVPDECVLYLRDRSGENLYMAIDYELLAPGVYSFPVGMDNIVPDHVELVAHAPDGTAELICVHLEW